MRGTELRAADRATVVEVLEHLTPPLVRYRSDRNGGIDAVRPELILLERKRRYRAPASTTPAESE